MGIGSKVSERDIEFIAKGVHEAWQQERTGQGWKYGETTDRARKTHESMIPYEDLTEDEKDLDRRTVKQVIEMLVSLGYRIEK